MTQDQLAKAGASAPGDGATRRKISTPRKILFTLICLVGALMLAEAGLRVRAHFRYGSARGNPIDRLRVYDKELGISTLAPGYVRSGSRASFGINALGFRGDEFTKEKPPGTIRIVCLGASTTFCGEAKRSWPHRLQEKLRERYSGVGIEVINAGVPGFRIEQSLVNLEARVLPLDPDLVIVYHANNDIVRDTRRLALDRGLIDAPTTRGSGIVGAITRYSLLARLLRMNLKIELQGNSKKLNELPEDLPSEFIATLDRIHERLQAEDIELVLSPFLVKYRRNQDRDTRIANANVAFYYMPWMTIEQLLNAMDMYNGGIIDFARAHGIAIAADGESIPADAQHFADCMHLADEGCAKMADRFFALLTEEGIMDKLIAKMESESKAQSP